MAQKQKSLHLPKEYRKVLEEEGFDLNKKLKTYIHRSGMLFILNPNLDPRTFYFTASNSMSDDEVKYHYEQY